MHKSHISDLNGPLHDHIATTYGVSANSILNSCRFFYVVDGIVPDVMHDVLEGTTQVTMRCLLGHCIQEQKFFSLSLLNERIVSFDYGHVDSQNRPSEISRTSFASGTLKQSGKCDIFFSNF